MKATIVKMGSISPGNPFNHDLYHMGMEVGQDMVMMFQNHPREKCEYLIFVNTKTGERIKVLFR